jgi:hypothetical protein
MEYNGVQIEFLRFAPEYETKAEIGTIANKIHVQAPSDSTMKLGFEKRQDIIKGYCRIVSQTGTFLAEAVSDCPIAVARELEKQLKFQFAVWNRRRFLPTA